MGMRGFGDVTKKLMSCIWAYGDLKGLNELHSGAQGKTKLPDIRQRVRRAGYRGYPRLGNHDARLLIVTVAQMAWCDACMGSPMFSKGVGVAVITLKTRAMMVSPSWEADGDVDC